MRQNAIWVRPYNSKGVDKKPKCKMGFDFDLLEKKCSKQLNIEGWTKMKQKVRRGSGRIPQKGWTKMRQTAIWSSGVLQKSTRSGRFSPLSGASPDIHEDCERVASRVVPSVAKRLRLTSRGFRVFSGNVVPGGEAAPARARNSSLTMGGRHSKFL